MKFSKFYAPSLKEAPKDATLASHIFLTRAGFITQVGSGLYTFLPLGKRVLDKIEKIVKKELDKSGAIELQAGFVTPANLWQQSGRWDHFGKELLRFTDRKENPFVLAPTHEEVLVDLVKNKITSYKQLPLNLYQITSKFRDEARPRFGLLRGREFIMKDGYSFHANTQDLKREFDLMEKTYNKIFNALGLKFRSVEADSGAIGGSGSREFMALASSGEDDILYCSKCEYAANVEAAKRQKRLSSLTAPEADFAKFKTPDTKSIQEVADFFHVDPFYTIKAVIKKAIFSDHEEIIVFFVRGDENLQEVKALNASKALELVDADEQDIKNANLVAGFCGPIGLDENVKFFIDSELKDEENLIIGANEKDYHFVGAKVCSFLEERYADLIEVKHGDKCLKCGEKLQIAKGIEVGHIFQLGQKYAKALNANFLNEQGKSEPFYMGCYGIGVSRLVAVMVEAFHDEKGIIWNKQTAPFCVDIIVSNMKDEAQKAFGDKLYKELLEHDVEVIYDDRKERFGFKMNDFELMGFPFAVVIGKGLQNDEVELIERDGLIKHVIKTSDIKDEILKRIG